MTNIHIEMYEISVDQGLVLKENESILVGFQIEKNEKSKDILFDLLFNSFEKDYKLLDKISNAKFFGDYNLVKIIKNHQKQLIFNAA